MPIHFSIGPCGGTHLIGVPVAPKPIQNAGRASPLSPGYTAHTATAYSNTNLQGRRTEGNRKEQRKFFKETIDQPRPALCTDPVSHMCSSPPPPHTHTHTPHTPWALAPCQPPLLSPPKVQQTLDQTFTQPSCFVHPLAVKDV